MKLTKKQEAEILKVYHAYWDAYLSGDMKAFASMLDDNIKIIGTAISEVFRNKKEAIRFYKATSDQLTGKAQFRNRKISVQPVDNTIVVNEQSDFYVLIENRWTFYGHARVSGLFHKIKKKWKLIHQHASFPDMRTGQGEQLAVEKIKEENLQLKEAVNRRTVELQQKNIELEIESSLERVRTVAMGMREPVDMLQVCKTISSQLEQLSIKEIRNVQTAIFYETKGVYTNFEYYPKHDKQLTTEVNYRDHPVAQKFAAQMMNGYKQVWSHGFKNDEVREWLKYQKTTNVFIDSYLETAGSLDYYWYSLGPVALGISVYHTLNDNEIELFKRFGNVFELAYRRFMDIEQAESQAKEAQIEAALERVRSRTMAMHKSDELLDVIKVVSVELQQLHFKFDTVSFGVNGPEYDLEFWMAVRASPEPNQHRVPYLDNPVINRLKDAQKKGTGFFADILTQEENRQWINHLADYADLGFPHEGRHLFPRGVKDFLLAAPGYARSTVILQNIFFFIGNYSATPYTDEENAIFKRFANVFEQAYTRFLDLQKAEAHSQQAADDLVKLQTEKKRAEDALTELQAAQRQLIQSEKMASLGELTAGIAHEIQNPLNFVNNFSEVSKELLDEMKMELENGNAADAKVIANDVIQNLEKINHHGKRADAIVKGMLQHSRTSNGQKELTDINALADEYLRLAYHGLRAKDKSFNANFKTDFDNGIGNVKIIPQDVGRVILNLLTNAFYAVNQKKEQQPAGYEPIVSVSTRRIGDKAEIQVSDNGNGIPQKLMDKIFQPFFTTKPTGQGTGLGLSLSYDIITKGHGGELKVETKEGVGSTFTIHLPVN